MKYGYIVVSWWTTIVKDADILPVVTFHRSRSMAMREKIRRQEKLGKNARVILAKII